MKLEFIKELFKSSKKLPIDICGENAYYFLSGIEIIFFLVSKRTNEIVAFACFEQQPHISDILWIAREAWTFNEYSSNAYIPGLYGVCKNLCTMNIQGDFVNSEFSKKIWNTILPKSNLTPTIIDTEDCYYMYDFDPLKYQSSRYCYLLTYNDHYSNKVDSDGVCLNWLRLYATQDKTKFNNPLYDY